MSFFWGGKHTFPENMQQLKDTACLAGRQSQKCAFNNLHEEQTLIGTKKSLFTEGCDWSAFTNASSCIVFPKYTHTHTHTDTHTL